MSSPSHHVTLTPQFQRLVMSVVRLLSKSSNMSTRWPMTKEHLDVLLSEQQENDMGYLTPSQLQVILSSKEKSKEQLATSTQTPGTVAVVDPIVEKVLKRVADRSTQGMETYGVSMMRNDVTTIEWLRHAQEEALDLAVYLERVIFDLEEQQYGRGR
jgi:hypothetical protein